MRKYQTISVLAAAFLAFVTAIVPVGAQSSDLGLSIKALPSTTSPGTTVTVASLATNNTSKRQRVELTFTALSPCGTEANIGFTKVVLEPGQTKFISGAYTIPPDACLGMYTLTVSADSGNGGGKDSSSLASQSSASTYLEVK